MKRYLPCEGTRHYRLSDGRLKSRACRHQFTWTSVRDSVRLPNTTKHHLPELFELGAASCRQRFQAQLSWAASIAFCVPVVPRPSDCGSVEGAIQCDEATFAGATKGKRGQGAAGKVIVFGRVKRNDRVKAMPIPARDRMPIMLEIDAHTREDTLY